MNNKQNFDRCSLTSDDKREKVSLSSESARREVSLYSLPGPVVLNKSPSRSKDHLKDLKDILRWNSKKFSKTKLDRLRTRLICFVLGR